MPATFSQTTRALTNDGPRGSLVTLAVALPLLLAWAAWFVFADITVHEVTERGRVEVSLSAHDVDAPVTGRVVQSRLELGLEVREGDVLLELDAELERARLAQERTKLASIEPELAARRRQLDAKLESLSTSKVASAATVAEAKARRDELSLAADQAREEAERARRMHESGLASEADRRRAENEAARRGALVAAANHELARLGGERKSGDVLGLSDAEGLRSQIAALEGEQARARAAAELLQLEIDRRTLRARVSGKLGEISRVGVGQIVQEGERLGAIVPEGELRAVAELSPEAALGRVEPGQRARLRLRGFPWTQYGVVPAEVSRVGSEVRDGIVRVELRLMPSPESRIPLAHGLPGSVEIDVDRASPAELLFRTVGRALAHPVGGRSASP